MRILTILTRYGLDQYSGAEETLWTLVARQLPGIAWDLVIVDNALPMDSVERGDHRTLLGGDNRSREFTAFDRGVSWTGPSLAQYDFVHFATSAFDTLYTGYLDRFTVPVLRATAGRSVCLGHIDCYNEPVRLGSFVSQHWIRSCFFFLRPDAIRALGSFVSVREGSAYFSGDPAAPFRTDAPVSPAYRRYVIDWLTGGDIGQGVTWHSKIPLTRDTLPSFESKALSIFNEHLLSVRLRALGCRIVDVTWLSTLVGRMRTETVPWELNWRQQLTDRDRDSVTTVR